LLVLSLFNHNWWKHTCIREICQRFQNAEVAVKYYHSPRVSNGFGQAQEEARSFSKLMIVRRRNLLRRFLPLTNSMEFIIPLNPQHI
jgi:hypothetical protein